MLREERTRATPANYYDSGAGTNPFASRILTFPTRGTSFVS
jgi:hypothetical protein